MHLPIQIRFTQVWRRGGYAFTGSVAAMTLVVGIAGPAAAAQLTLTWADTSTNEDGFKVERKREARGPMGSWFRWPPG